MVKETKLTPEQFVVRAIPALRNGKSKGIHSVFSGFNNAWKSYFPRADVKAATQALVEAGVITMHPVRKGMMIYLKGEEPAGGSSGNALAKILG